MASLAESSVASVPIPDLQSLQGHLLQHRRLSADAQATTIDLEASEIRLDNDSSRISNSIPNGDNDEIAESIDAGHPPSRATRAQPPHLTPSRSAPADVDAMAHETPSQHAFATMTRAVSFHGYAGGDTQPMDSQVYRDFTESMVKSTTTTPRKREGETNGLQDADFDNTYDTAVTDKSMRTVAEGETGFIDLANAWQQPEISQTVQSATSDLEDLLGSPNTQSNIHTNSLPKTPALPSSKRHRIGELPSSTATDAYKRTPGLSQAFGMTSKMPTLSVSQLFNQTQAPSSPMLDFMHSDPVLSRPSPKLQNQAQFSSPGITTSSPMLMMHNPPASTAGEPRETYTSMRESQERRAARLRKELELEGRFGPDAGAVRTIDEEDEEEDSIQRRTEHKRMQRVMSDQALDEWNRYRAPSRPGSRTASSRKGVHMIDLVTPLHTRTGQRVEFDVSDDEDNKEDERVEPELPRQQEVAEDEEGLNDEENAECDDENDVYDEFSQTVFRSQRDTVDVEDAGSVLEDEPEDGSGDGEAVDEDVIMNDQDITDEIDDNILQQGSTVAATQPAVADSQPEQGEALPQLSKRAAGEPSTSSFVPGSQYLDKSQERARQMSRIPNSSIAQQPRAAREQGMPSSPPLDIEDDTVPADRLEASAARQGILARFQDGQVKPNGPNPGSQEAPESDRLQEHVVTRSTEPSGFATAAESNSAPLFSTARTHRSDTAPSPRRPQLLQALSRVSASQQSAPSPLKAAGVRRFAEMAAESSSAGDNADSNLNVDDVIGGFLTGEDQNFIDILSSPPSVRMAKRRKTNNRSASRPIAADVPTVDEQMGEDGVAGGISLQKAPTPDASDEQLSAIAPIAMVQALQSSPNKASQVPQATPEEATAPDTPESVRRREAAGRNAVSQLLSARTARIQQPSKLSGTGRKAAANREREKLPPLEKLRAKDVECEVAFDASKIAATSRVHARSTLDGTYEGNGPRGANASPTNSRNQRPFSIAANRILALFKGASYNAYYPATWLSMNSDGRSHKVRFDDTTVTSIDAKDIRTLDVRPGDVVKVDFEGYRTKTWVVKEFGRKAHDDDDRANGVDIYDHVTVKVQAKMAQRVSLPASGLAIQGEGEIFEVLVTNIKLTHTMIPHFSDRVFTPPVSIDAKVTRAGTPSNSVHTPELETPTSRTRRSIVPSAKASAMTSRLREGSIASASDRSTTGMFEDMAFAISYLHNDSEKAEVTRQIRRHGGRILEQGFDELFVPPQLNEPLTPSKRSSKAITALTSEGTGKLRLKSEYQNLGFVALIANKHSRRAKYIQALSLGLPTLAGRWILDSLDPARNPSFSSAEGPDPRSWARYLLPAGESSYLGGAVRSRTLTPYAPASALLASTVASREMMLKGEGVLLAASKKGKDGLERRRAFAFLTLALGAGNVKRVADLAEAKALLAHESEKWAWVYTDEDVAQAAGVLFGKKGAGVGGAGGKKRKRGADASNGKEMCIAGMDGRVRVVGDEFVVQSLILGALVD